MGPPHEGSIRRPISTMSKRSYHGATSRSPTIELHLVVITSGVRCSSMVRAFAHSVMGHWIDPVLSCLWDGAYKRTLAANQKE